MSITLLGGRASTQSIHGAQWPSSLLQKHAEQAAHTQVELAKLKEEQATAAAALLAAKGSLSAREQEAKLAEEASKAAAKLLADPPEPLMLEAHSRSESDLVKVLTLDQMLDYRPSDNKVLPSSLSSSCALLALVSGHLCTRHCCMCHSKSPR
jgi:regulator of protease activity HflC (stomatin/prohibitin superfamily)